jgi:hypothetical protein
VRDILQKAKHALVGEETPPPTPAQVHISQVGDEIYNSSAPNATANCGPASVIMALRLIGREVPGADQYQGEDLVEYVRYLATGNTNRLVGTTNVHLQKIIQMSGASYRQLTHPKDMLRAVLRGAPVIMAGNPTAKGAYPERYDYIDVRRWDSGHWIVVSNYDADKQEFVVNDPQSTIGPIYATTQQLYAFSAVDGNFGLAIDPA